MKARTLPVTYSEIKKQVAIEVAEQRDKIFEDNASEFMTQALSTIFWTLSTRFGWGEKRLKTLVEALHDTNDLMNNPSRLHHKFSPLDCEQIIKDKYGIDLRAEFRPQVEIKRR